MGEIVQSVSIVGATGGAGATRLSIELASTLARDGRRVGVLDSAYATQGASRYVSGRIDTDVTAVCADDEPFEDALFELALDLPGSVSLCPANAPFERIARAKTATAAERFGELVAAAEDRFDAALVDVPPIAANQSVGAATVTQRRGIVAPATPRGSDAVQRTRERLADVGTAADAVIANRAPDDGRIDWATVSIPRSSADELPASGTSPDRTFAPAVAAAAEHLFDTTLDVEFPEPTLWESVSST